MLEHFQNEYLGFILITIFIDSTTKNLSYHHHFFMLATDIPWQGGVAIKTSKSSIFSFFNSS